MTIFVLSMLQVYYNPLVMKRRVLILGGGISGLSAAFFLSKYPDQFEVILLEGADRAGGWLGSFEEKGFFFEKTARTFSTKRSVPLLQLIAELGLTGELISPQGGHKRYIWSKGALQAFPGYLFKWRLIKGLLKEPFVAPRSDDESIWDFAVRRFNVSVAEELFDPLTLGVYGGGDLRRLSMESSFPTIKKLEREHGSLVKGLLSKKKRPKPLFSAPLFSLKSGTSQLIDALGKSLSSSLHLGQNVEKLSFSPQGVEAFTNKGHYSADLLISALPSYEIARLLSPSDRSIAEMLEAIPLQNLQVVYLGYLGTPQAKGGFGYLIPSREKQRVMGAVFDSAIFPQHNRRKEETRLTYMIRDGGQSGQETIAEAKAAATAHLQMQGEPELAYTVRADRAIPQYLVGHKANLAKLTEALQERFPRCALLGNYLQGVSVSDCVAQSRQLAEHLIESAH
jgi:oxygen-dependent protoporphyrinogen oxidase